MGTGAKEMEVRQRNRCAIVKEDATNRTNTVWWGSPEYNLIVGLKPTLP